jgi:nucleotide-binding universal stress UspA family protein
VLIAVSSSAPVLTTLDRGVFLFALIAEKLRSILFNTIWAVDAFHSNPKVQLRALRAAEAMAGKKPLQVTPVSVLPWGRFDAESLQFLNKWHDLASVAGSRVSKLLKSEKSPHLKPHRLLSQEKSSLSRSVTSLIQFAISEKADLIVTSTHGRSGPAKLVIGSFAENLVYQSPIPVLLVNPNASSLKRIKSILFATDFSDASYAAFKRVVVLANQIGAEVVLFHKLQFPTVEGLPPLLFSITPSEMRENIQATGQKWLKWGEQQGVKMQLQINTGNADRLKELQKACKKLGNSAVLAMAAQSGPLESNLLGSLTQKAIRSNSCPILVIRSEQETLIKKFLSEVTRLGYAYTAQPLIR